MIKFDARFYPNQRTAFERWPRYNQIESLVRNGVDADENELLVYSTYDQQASIDGRKGFPEMRHLLTDSEGMLRRYFDLSGGTVHYRQAARSYSPVVAKIGVATSLVTANRIFDLHAADWTAIPESTKWKTMDFWYASDGTGYIEVEAKGTIVDDADEKSESVYKHKEDIVEKKKEQLAAFEDKSEASLLGVIAAIPRKPGQRAVVWLVDPPAEPPPMDPLKFKLLTRMRFYFRWMRAISQSTILTALRNRIEAIRASSQFRDLDRVALLGPGGGRFRVSGPFFRHKATIGREVIGRVFPLEDRRFMFFGLDVDVYRMMARQGFEEIVGYRSRLSGEVSKVSDVVVTLDEKELEGLDPGELGAVWLERERRYRLVLTGPVLFERSGLALGALKPKLPQQEKEAFPRAGPEYGNDEIKKLQDKISQGALSLPSAEKVPIR